MAGEPGGAGVKGELAIPVAAKQCDHEKRYDVCSMQLSDQLTRAFTSMARLVRELEGDLSRPDFTVLAHLSRAAEEGVTVRSRDLSRSEELDPSTVSRRLASLADRGLIDRQPDPGDGRAHLVSLTEAGHGAVRVERTRRVALITDALVGWDETDREDLARLLGQLSDTLEAQRADRRDS